MYLYKQIKYKKMYQTSAVTALLACTITSKPIACNNNWYARNAMIDMASEVISFTEQPANNNSAKK